MGTITAQTIVDKAQVVLQDTTGIRWADPELLGWLNAGQREIVALRPDAYTSYANVPLVAGTRQAIPTNGIMLIDVVRNTGIGGTSPSRSVRKVPRELLDSQVPNWHSANQSAEVLHYTFEPRAPKVFYVYPPATGTTEVEVLYSVTPPDITVGQPIVIDDIYEMPLMDYVLFRAYSKDSEHTANEARAVAHRQSFENTLGLKAQADGANVKNPNVRG